MKTRRSLSKGYMYYPYGLPTFGTAFDPADPYLYLGKEFSVERGVNLYDFEARTYAPDISRFMQPDPMAEDYYDISPYAYCAGDPVNKIDPDGRNIVVLYSDIATGHLALLIQRPDKSWLYYSVNGDKIFEITSGQFGEPPTMLVSGHGNLLKIS